MIDMSLKWTLLITASTIISAERCPTPEQGNNLYLHCSFGRTSVHCADFLRPGTKIRFQCSPFWEFDRAAHTEIQCLRKGNWNHPAPRCVPSCGKVSSAVPLIVNGKTIEQGIFPWHAALYRKGEGIWDFQCGASLISARMVVTAAHCAFLVEASDLRVALGKKFREENATGDTAQIIPVHSIELLETYQDVEGNYNGDLAVLLLSEPADLTETVQPICFDSDESLLARQLREGNMGIVLGWGLTENDTFSDELRALRMPVMSDDKCIQHQQRDFKKYITYTTFCAGYTNGTGVCNGDSGGGLAFLDPKTDKWYIQGIVSVSPRRRGTPYCDPNHYTVFTKVARFGTWLRKIQEKELALEALQSISQE